MRERCCHLHPDLVWSVKVREWVRGDRWLPFLGWELRVFAEDTGW